MELETKTNSEKRENHMDTGMCLGMAAGAVGMCICAFLDQLIWGGLCVAVGLLIGMVIGSAIPKKK